MNERSRDPETVKPDGTEAALRQRQQAWAEWLADANERRARGARRLAAPSPAPHGTLPGIDRG